MNEFILWDKERFRYCNTTKSTEQIGDFIYWETIRLNPNYLKSCANGQYPTFEYIKKDDIEGNKIYADCSIVEFDYKTISHSEKRICIFTYDDYTSRYWLRYAGDVGTFEFDTERCKNIKIIDTVQENKLKLIK